MIFCYKQVVCNRMIYAFIMTCSITLSPIHGGSVEQLFKLTASQSAMGDRFGADVDIDGDVAIISASGDAEFGKNTGAAYLFDVASGEELFRLTASDATAGQWFGSDVAISGGLAMVAAEFDDEAGRDAGSVYVFDVATGEELYKLLPEDPVVEYHGFGSEIAMDGTIGVVGTRSFADEAYIFDLSTGEKLFDLEPTDPHTPSDFATTGFGSSVEINGNTAVVGAYIESEFGDNSGAAYLFDTTTGEMRHKLSASDAQANQFLGSRGTIAIDSGTIVTGAVEAPPNWDRGKAYFFDTESGEEQFALPTPEDDPDNYFAATIAISGDSVILGASNDTVDEKQFAGSAYLYDLNSGQMHKFLDTEGNAHDHFGISVASDGNLAIIGSTPRDSDGKPTDAGSVSVFRIAGQFGDVNNDGNIDVGDIDAISTAIRTGVTDAKFDLNEDGQVTRSDHVMLVTDILNTWLGDSNLDGEFNSGDFVKVFQASEFEDGIDGNSTWATGDWNGDGDFTTGDFVVAFQQGEYERGPKAAANTVPEPNLNLMLILGVTGFALARQRSRFQMEASTSFQGVLLRLLVGAIGMNLFASPTQAGGVYRWDNGELIPGTKHVVFRGPDVPLDGLALFRADLVGEFFSSAVDADFQEADLRRTNAQQINGANLTDAAITGSWLVRSNITAAQLYSTASYQQKDLKNTAIAAPNVMLSGWNLHGQDLSGSWLADCNRGLENATSAFVGTDFSDAHIVGVELGGATFGGFTKEQLYSTASYKSKHLKGIGLGQNDLEGWNFSGQNLSGANFNSGRLFGFDGCNSRGPATNLRDADFNSAILRGANLHSAELAGADFDGADLRGANLADVTGIADAHFDADTTYNQWTVFPDGFDPQGAGLKLIVSPVGDLSSNGILDAGDIDLLRHVRPLRFGHEQITSNRDLNGDLTIDNLDRDFWIHDLAGTSYGDANLDGEFNSSDLVIVFQKGEYEDQATSNSTWATGDWNGDGVFDTGDLVKAFQDDGYERGPRPAAHPVPEPTSFVIVTGSLIAIGCSPELDVDMGAKPWLRQCQRFVRVAITCLAVHRYYSFQNVRCLHLAFMSGV